MRRFLYEIIVFSSIIFFLHPFLVRATVFDGAPQNVLVGANNNYVGISNSGAYMVGFTLSGTLDAGNTFVIEATDGGSGSGSANYAAIGGESSGSVMLNLSNAGLAEGPITFSGTVYLTGTSSPVVASGITQAGVFDMTQPVISSTGTHIAGMTSVDFSGITVTEVNFSGATLSYSGVSSGSEVGTITLQGTIGNLTGTVTSLTPGAIYSYTITATDLASNTATLLAGTFTTNNVPDTTPPDFAVSSHADNQTVTGSTATLAGTVTDTGGVASVTVNGFPATLGTGTWFRTLTGLTAGVNTFMIIATDTSGNTGSTTWHLDRLSVPANVNATLSGRTDAIVTFDTDITATGVVLYGTTSGSLTTTVTGSIAGTSHATDLSGLSPNTTYYYQVHGVSGSGQTGDSSSILSFKTPLVVDVDTASGAITVNGPVFLSGATSTGAVFMNSGSLNILSATESGSLIFFSFSGLTISASGGGWDSVLQGPEIVSEIPTGVDTGYMFIGKVYQIGNAFVELGFSGQTVSVTLHVGTSLSGQVIRIYRSTNGGTSYALFTTCMVTGGGDCTFSTNQLSLFAPAIAIDTTPDAFAFTDITNTELSTVYDSNLITVTGINTPATVSVLGGQYSVNGGVFTSTASTVNNGDTVRLRVTSSASYSASVSATLTIGGVSDTYTVSTKANPSSGGGGGGSSGGGGPVPPFPPPGAIPDNCPNGDYSASYYDGLCSMPPALGGATWSITKDGNNYTITITTASGTSITLFHIPPVTLLLQDIRFHDIPNNWARSYIRKLVVRGIIDNALRYRPNDYLTRAEFLKIVINTAGWQTENGSMIPFRDVISNVWYAPYVSIALSKGMITDTNLFFRPNDPISRSEATKIVITALGAKVDDTVAITFTDVNRNSDLTKYVETAKLLGILSGQIINGSLHFRPNDPITRAEIAKVVVNSFGL